MRAPKGRLLLVIPTVVRRANGRFEVDADFSNNLRIYLANFAHVTFACPIASDRESGNIVRSLPIETLPDRTRLTFVELPYTYREDRYLRHYLGIRKLLRREIAAADYLLFSPHANYDWPTFAARLAIEMNRKYDVEFDLAYDAVLRFHLAAMPPGLRKARKKLWTYLLSRSIRRCLAHSSLALLQGQDVFEAYKNFAPNARKVLNVQVSATDRIPPAQLEAKLAHIRARAPLTVSYAGQMIARKGPMDWLKAVHCAVTRGARLRATWFGGGELMPMIKEEIARLGMQDDVVIAGLVGREEIMNRLRTTDLFLFCHKTAESPRNLGEALAAGCPLVGYETAYSRDLVAEHGGGEFVAMDDWEGLAERLVSLDRDRERLARLVAAAAESGRCLDRDTAMQGRVDLIRGFLG